MVVTAKFRQTVFMLVITKYFTIALIVNLFVFSHFRHYLTPFPQVEQALWKSSAFHQSPVFACQQTYFLNFNNKISISSMVSKRHEPNKKILKYYSQPTNESQI